MLGGAGGEQFVAVAAFSGHLVGEADSAALRTLQFAAVAVPLDGDFARAREHSAAVVRRLQLQYGSVHAPETARRQDHVPLICEKDGVRAAVERNGVQWVSAPVAARRTYGTREKKGEFYLRDARRGEWCLPGTLVFANDFDELTSHAPSPLLEGKMAVISMDGNGFGEHLRTACGTPESHRAFDEKLRAAQGALLYDLVNDLVPQDAKRHPVQVEAFVWAGDDLMFVVPAHCAWRVIGHIYSSFVPALPTGLSYRTGVVFCHHTAPIREVKALADELQGVAKKTGGPSVRGAVTYEVMESFDALGRDVLEYRELHCPDPALRRGLVLNGAGIAEGVKALPRVLDYVSRRTMRKIEVGLRSQSSRTRAEARELVVVSESDLVADGVNPADIALLREAFNGDAWWLHAGAMFDYLAEAAHA